MWLLRSLLQSVSTPYAILDLHFSISAPNILAVATSIGAVSLYACDFEPSSESLLKHIYNVNVADPTVLVLALAWSPLPAWSSTIAVSLSTGQIGIFDYQIRDAPVLLVQAHSLEAWTVAWSLKNALNGDPYLYSGGDDSALSVHNAHDILDRGTPAAEAPLETVYEPTSRDAKSHGAGVTAILPLILDPARDRETLLTGSYDEFLRVIVPKLPGIRTAVLAEKQLGGGVWRLKLVESSQIGFVGGMKFKILASCMHSGVKVVEVSCSPEGDWSIETRANFKEHESMNYASDARAETDEQNIKTETYISTSFYDKKLCVWEMKKDHADCQIGKDDTEEKLSGTS
jgi:diphthamide biosynthesis protein 7